MKKTFIVALVCVNVVLLAALVAVDLDKASAQTLRGGNLFIMATGKIESTFDAVYVVDMKSRRIGAWRFDRTAKRLVSYKGRDLEADFKAK